MHKACIIIKSVVIAGLLGSLFIQRKPIQNGLVHATHNLAQQMSSASQRPVPKTKLLLFQTRTFSIQNPFPEKLTYYRDVKMLPLFGFV